MMEETLCFLGWEWVNISLEFTAVAWVRLPRLFLAVAGVNLVTHPALMFILDRFGRDTDAILAFEAGIVLAEWLMLVAVYGKARWRLLAGMALLMNIVSYATGLLLDT
ncbi:MAG: hypothetical protein IKO72_04870 [Kiritimatiellae bacterium]|nr:hypothetical protein [Kiritimatiellia bacterium]